MSSSAISKGLALAVAVTLPVALPVALPVVFPIGAAHAQLAADAHEAPPNVELDNVFPESLMQSGSHRVEDNLQIKGTLFEFTIDSDHGVYDVLSIPMTILRIHEIRTLAQATDAFQRDNQQLAERLRSIAYAGSNTPVDIYHSPLEYGGDPSIYLNNNVGRTIEQLEKKSRPGEPEAAKGVTSENLYESMLPGDPILASYKRAVAQQLDLDVFSSNSRVQAFLDTLARARAGGNRNAGMVTVSLPQHPEISVDSGRIEFAVRTAVARKTVRELYVQNEATLAAMGIEPDLLHAFLSHRAYSPRHKSEIVAYLAFMQGVADRGEFLRAAVRAEDEVAAVGYSRMARMLAFYHETTERLSGLVSGGNVLMASTTGGNMTLVLPFDVLWWSTETDSVFSRLARFADEQKFKMRELLVVGVVSEKARLQLESRKFMVREKYLLRR